MNVRCPAVPAALFCAVLLLCPTGLCAQSLAPLPDSNQPTTDPGPWVPSLRALGQDALDIATAPVELTRSQQVLALSGTGLIVSTVVALDRPAYRHVSVGAGPLSQTTRPLAAPGRWYDRVGPDRMALGTAGVLAAGGLVLQRRALTRTSVRVVEALVYTKLATGLAKSVFNRSRPFTGQSPLTADPGAFSGAHEKLSMPSGHTARAFAIASVLAHQADRWYVSLPAYGVAASVALERVRSGDHWLTDVMVGSTLGYLIGRSVASTPAAHDAVSYTPVLSTDRVGVSVHF